MGQTSLFVNNMGWTIRGDMAAKAACGASALRVVGPTPPQADLRPSPLGGLPRCLQHPDTFFGGHPQSALGGLQWGLTVGTGSTPPQAD